MGKPAKKIKHRRRRPANRSSQPAPGPSAYAEGLKTVLEMADDLIPCSDPDTLYRRAVELARNRLGIERCAIYLVQKGRLYGTYGTDIRGRTTDEHKVFFADTARWKNEFRVSDGTRIPWEVTLSARYGWGGGKSGRVKKGWIVRTPIVPSGHRPIGYFFNDCAISHAPLDPVKQDVVGVYCALLSQLIERIRAENALRKNEDMFRRQYRNLPLPTLTWQKTRTGLVLVGYNRAAMKTSRTLTADRLGKRAEDLLRKRPDIMAHLRRCMATRSTVRHVTLYRHSDGTEQHMALTHVFVPPDYVMTHSEDISARVVARQKQEALARGLRAVLDITNGLMHCRDITHLYRRTVELARKKLGLERCSIFVKDGALVRGTFGTDLHGRTTDERAMARKATPEWNRMFCARYPPGRPWTLETMALRNLEGRRFKAIGRSWVARVPIARHGNRPLAVFFNDTAITHTPFDPIKQDLAALLCSLVADIIQRLQVEEALRESEQKLYMLIENAGAGISIVDRDGVFLFMNTPAAIALGEKNPRKLFNRTMWQLFPRHHANRQMNSIRKAIRYHRRLFRENLTIVNGNERWYETTILPFQQIRHPKPCAMVIVRDITARHEFDRKIRTYQDQLRGLASELLLAEEHERRRLAAEVHDSISQPLAMAKFELDALLESSRAAKSRNPLQRVSGLLMDAIQHSRSLTSTLSPPALYELGLEAALENMADKIQSRHGLVVEFRDDQRRKNPGENWNILLFRAAQELLVNVVKHAHARKATLTISRKKGYVHIVVADDGIGFNPRKTPPYGDGTAGGFGLLSIRERLHNQGGHFEIRSRPGRGTRAVLMAPLKTQRPRSPA